MHSLKKHIVWTRLLLLIFIGEQIILFTHEHEIGKCCGEISRSHFSKDGIHTNRHFEICALCDVVLHKKILLTDFYSFIIYRTLTILKTSFLELFHLVFLKETHSRGPPVFAPFHL